MIDDRTKALMMAAIDDELTPEDRRELEALAARSPAVREEWDRLAKVGSITQSMTWKEPAVETCDRYWGNVYNRTERKVAWLLLLAGGLVIAGWGLWESVPAWFNSIWEDESMPVAVRIAVVTAALGGLLLVVSVVREQLTVKRTDPYDKGVIR
jgi:ferric-dicitrate binding protein FerR (iron transport regulator)